MESKNRNKKGQFIKGHQLGLRFGAGQVGFYGHNHSLETKAKLKESHLGKKNLNYPKKRKKRKFNFITYLKISQTLKGKEQPWNQGNKHWNWKGGKSRNSRKLNSKRRRKMSRKVFIRDKFTCQICGKKGGKIEADHIKPYIFFPKLRWNMNNLRTLCHKCHIKTETYGAKVFQYKAYK